MRRTILVLAALATAATTTTSAYAAPPAPAPLPLPPGQAEGLAPGPGGTVYVGSIPTGAVFQADLRTGEVRTVVPATEGGQTTGLKADRLGRLWTAGGDRGDARVYDATTGEALATLELGGGFVNDVVLTRKAAYFTDSLRAFVYRVPIGPRGQIGDPAAVPITGDLVYRDDLTVPFNVNGVEATPNGSRLLLVQSNTGQLFSADPRTGITTEVDLGGEVLVGGNGLVLRGRTLYVSTNPSAGAPGRTAVVRLSADVTSGSVVGSVDEPGLDTPTTLALAGGTLVAVDLLDPSAETDPVYTLVEVPTR